MLAVYVCCCRCADLDCDGVITPSEMWHFYEEQMKRLEGLNQEPVLFEDVLCQLHDMLQVRPAHSTPALARQLQHAVAAPVRGHACMAVSTCAVSMLRTPLSSRGSHVPLPSYFAFLACARCPFIISSRLC